MSRDKKKSRFKDIQSGYHRSAVDILARWTGGKREKKFYLGGQYYFVPDVTIMKNKVPIIFYEVIYKHQFTGHKLGRMQLWCYCNAVDMKVCEVSADWILSQTDKPLEIKTENQFNITVF
jgi:hypothetical protein